MTFAMGFISALALAACCCFSSALILHIVNEIKDKKIKSKNMPTCKGRSIEENNK